MIEYRQATLEDFDFAYSLKKNSLKEYIEKIWGWDEEFQLSYHKQHFNPELTQIILDARGNEIGLVSYLNQGRIVVLENIVIDPNFRGKGIGTLVLNQLIHLNISQGKNVDLKVFKINTRARTLYERLNFKIISETDLHYNMRLTEEFM